MLRRSNVMEIVNFSITPKTAVANGADIISASAVIMNGNDYVSDKPVVFTITTGSAIFSNGLSSIVVSSNSLGAVSASLVDTTAETVVVEIALQSDASIRDSLTATFTRSDNTADTISLLLAVDDARADGEDQNQVELQTLSGAVPVSGTSVSVALTNGAVFISGDKTAKIKTDSKGRASLPFTSTTAGESKLTAYLSDNIAVYNSVTATFVSASPELSLALDVVSDNAQANGNAVNRVRATVTDSDTHKPLSGQVVTFTVTSGSAVFDNDSATYSATTDSNGEAYASVKDETVESVIITTATGDKTATGTVHFSQEYSPLKIDRIYNKNKIFLSGHPLIAWKNAELFISVSGGSGNYSCGGSNGISATIYDSNTVLVVFSLSDEIDCTITLTDNVTSENIKHTLHLETYYIEVGDWYTFYPSMKNSYGVDYPSVQDLVSLYEEWGDMSLYPEWIPQERDGCYWASSEKASSAPVVNLKNGHSSWRETWTGYSDGGWAVRRK